jgi:hypothetical protein
VLHAYIDESGQLANTRRSSDHFVLAAIVCRDSNLVRLDRMLSRLKVELGRRPDDRLQWKNIKRPEQRTHVAQTLGQTKFIKIVAIVVCKRYLAPPITDLDAAYLFTLRFLLERLSWLGELHRDRTGYTLAHIKRFKALKLKDYEAKLGMIKTEIKWEHLDLLGGRISNDLVTPRLQLADLTASATAKAFETSETPSEPSLLRQLLPAFYRGQVAGNPNVLTSYGLKMHPWGQMPAVRERYRWVAELR